jgi:hypothetical protein
LLLCFFFFFFSFTGFDTVFAPSSTSFALLPNLLDSFATAIESRRLGKTALEEDGDLLRREK